MVKSYGQSWYRRYGYVDKVVAWCPADQEHLFDANMADPKKRALLEQYGWTRDNVSYTFNKEGFRSDEFTDGENDSVLFLGCSHTIGIGMDLESSWTYKVASSLGLRRYNLGVGAGSADTCFRLAQYWIPRLRPKYVMMLTPANNRMELIEDSGIIQFIPSMTTHSHTNNVAAMVEGFYKSWLSHPANSELNRLKNVMGVQMMCNSIGIPMVDIPIENLYNAQMAMSKARDLLHPGREWNKVVAERFLDKIGA